VHRDVTPSNILISFAGEVKLSDFGLAKRRHDRSVVGSLKGNLAYMSPEQAKQAELDRRTDIFSLGAILFELLTGKRLREITDEVAGWNQVASGVLPSARQVRPDLARRRRAPARTGARRRSRQALSRRGHVRRRHPRRARRSERRRRRQRPRRPAGRRDSRRGARARS
jgi:serine/threonine protein kinase